MKLNEIRFASSVVGAILAERLGGFDGLLEVLTVFIIVDYVTGIFCAIAEKKLSSEIGFKGIVRKVLIFVLVGMANAVDVFVLKGDEQLIRTAVIFFYLSNEGISILENASRIGLPIPQKLRDFLQQLKDKNDSDKKSR